jgi:hypothetical protein
MYFKGMLWSAMIWCDGILLAVGYGFIVVQLDGCFISKNNVFKFLVGSYQFFTKIYSFCFINVSYELTITGFG